MAELTGLTLGGYVKNLGVTPEAEDRPWYKDAYEVGRQGMAGAMVDLPRMAGQVIRRVSDDGSAADNYGREMVEAADARAPEWAPDTQGERGMSRILSKGARGLAPMAPAIAASMVPGGQWIAPTVAAGQFGLSSAQSTEDKLRSQGIPDDEATAAGWRTGMIQGPLEGIATAVGMRAFKPLAGMLGKASPTMQGVTQAVTNRDLLKPFAKSMGINAVVQPGTEVLQDGGSELVERAYGAKPEDLGAIAKDSAEGGLGMTLLLGPFAFMGHRANSKRAAQLDYALSDPTAPTELRQQAENYVTLEARKAGVSAEQARTWWDGGTPRLDENKQRDLLGDGTLDADLNRNQINEGLAEIFPQAETEAAAKTRRSAYAAQFGEAAGAPSGQFASDADTGLEYEMDAGQVMNQQVPLSPEEQIAKAASDASFKAEQEFLQRASSLGVPPKNTAGLKALRMLEDVQGEISPEDYGTLEGKVKAGQFGLVTDALNAREKAFANQAKVQEKAQADAVKAAQRETEKAQKDAVKAQEKPAKDAAREAERAAKAATPTAAEVAQQADTDNAPKAAPAGVIPASTATESVAPKSEVAVRAEVEALMGTDLAVQTPNAPAVMQAPKADVGAMADALVTKLGLDPKKVVMVGRKERQKSMTAREFAITLLTNPEDAGTPAKVKQAEIDRTVIMAAMGRDAEGDMVSAPLSLDQVALLRSRLEGGKPVTRAAIANTLSKFGLNEKLINMMVGGDLGSSISEAELAEGAETKDDRNFRVGRSLSDVTSNVLVDNNDTPAQKALSAEAAVFAKQDKLSRDNEAVDQYLAPPKQESKEVAANRLATAEATKAAPAPRVSMLDGQLNETEADEAYIKQRGVEKEIKKLQVQWNANLDEGDVAFADMPLELQLRAYKISRDEFDGLITTRQRREEFTTIQDEANRGTRTNNAGIQGPNAQAQIAGPREVRGGDGTASGTEQGTERAAPGRRDTDAVLAAPRDAADAQRQREEVTDVVVKEAPAPKGREVTAAEMAMVEWKAGDLAMPQTRKLEKAYNAETGTADFNQQLKADVEAFLNGGLSAVSKPEIASIVKDLAPEVAAVPLNGDVMQFATVAAAPANGGISAKDAQAAVDKVLDTLGLRSVVQIQVASNPAAVGVTVPQGVVPSGGTSNGKVYLFTDNIADTTEAFKVVFHELFHLGLSQSMPQGKYIQSMLKFLTDPTVRKYASEWKKSSDGQSRVGTLPVNNWNALAVEEALARISEETNTDAGGLGSKPAPGWVRNMIRTLADVAQDWGLPKVAQTLRSMTFTQAEKFVAETLRKGRTGAPVNLKDTRFSANSKAARFTPIKSGNAAIDAMPDALTNFYTLVKQKASDAGVRIMLTRDLAAIAANNGLTAATKYMAAMDAIGVEKTKSELAVQSVLAEFRTLPKHEQGTGPSSVNQLINDSTTKGVWAFAPDWLPGGTVTADSALETRLKGMSDKAQALVKKVFKHGFDTRKAMQEAATTNITTEYDGLIAALKAAGKVEEAAKETKAKVKALDDFKSLFSLNPNAPYAPKKRFGPYVVMGMSARYLQAEKDGDRKTMRALETNGDDYYVEFAETQAQANKLERDIQGSFPDGYTTSFEKLDQADGMMGGRDMLGALGRLRRMAKEQASEDGTKDTTSAAVDNLMRQMYLQLLSENSARKGEIHRRNISGADKDMMRAFSTQGIATAHFIASLKTSGKVDDNLDAMRSQVRERTPGREGRQRVFNELMRRHSLNLEFSPTPFVDKALATSSLYLLLSNPSYFLMNATQPWMMSHPMMAGKHGYSRSASALLTASKEVAMLLKNASFDVKDYNKLPQDVQRAVEALADKGVIDISLAADLGTFRSNDGGVTEPLAKVMGMLRGAAESVETFNRLSTAIAAYRLEKQRGSTDTQAVDYAANLIVETHGDYSGFNAPRFMRSGLGRVLTQFRKFQLIQLSMFARLLNRSLKGATADEKLIARKALTFNLAHLGAIGGAVALPGFTAVSWLLSAVFGDDDEPDDVKGKLARVVGEEWAELLMGGASKALGVPLGERIGAGGMFSILPYTELELSRTGYEKAFMAATGPLLGGLLPRAVDGMGMALNGDPWKGSEALMPALGANISKAIRFGTEGITKRDGKVALSADELSTLDLLGQAVGLQTSTIKDHYARTSTEFKADKFYNDRTSALTKAYIKAVRSNDTDGIREAREDWMAMQTARREAGLKVQPLSQLTRAPAERAAAEAKDRRERDKT